MTAAPSLSIISSDNRVILLNYKLWCIPESCKTVLPFLSFLAPNNEPKQANKVSKRAQGTLLCIELLDYIQVIF